MIGLMLGVESMDINLNNTKLFGDIFVGTDQGVLVDKRK